jgi:hypothetical protein
MTNRVDLFRLLALLYPSAVLAQAEQACESLRSLLLTTTTITTSAVVAGSFTPPGSSNPNATISNLPSCCRVAATLKPTADSEIYAPATNPRRGREIFPALQPGSELGWAGLAGPEPVRETVEFFQYVVSNDPTWDFRTLDFDADVARAEKAASRISWLRQ